MVFQILVFLDVSFWVYWYSTTHSGRPLRIYLYILSTLDTNNRCYIVHPWCMFSLAVDLNIVSEVRSEPMPPLLRWSDIAIAATLVPVMCKRV